MLEGEESYASEQLKGLQAALLELVARAREQVATQWPSWAETVQSTRETGEGIHRALLRVSDDAMCLAIVDSVKTSQLLVEFGSKFKVGLL